MADATIFAIFSLLVGGGFTGVQFIIMLHGLHVYIYMYEIIA